MANKVSLCILDGWGIAPDGPGNAISQTAPQIYYKLMDTTPYTQLEASGIGVGLPPDMDGNSETGHLNLGAGRVVPQDITRINMDIASGHFFVQPELLKVVDHVHRYQSALHLVGLISNNGVHAFNDHLFALIIFARRQGLKQVYLHLFTDGRDSPPKDALNQIKKVDNISKRYQTGEIVSLMGRYYAMDRDNRLDRTAKALDCLIGKSTPHFSSSQDCINSSYSQDITDEFVLPSTVGTDSEKTRIKPNDAVVFYNFRNDRPRQIVRALTNCRFPNLKIVTMTHYAEDIHHPYLFETLPVSQPLAQVISQNNLQQLRVSESEKERVTNYYFDGLSEATFPLCQKIVIPSPHVATYDQQPAMSTELMVDTFVQTFSSHDFTLAVMNIACPDMLAHTGNMEAAKKAVLATDIALGKLVAMANDTDSYLVITADHGNIEEMISPIDATVDTKHSNLPVPLLVYHPRDNHFILRPGTLGDVAPTILHLLNVAQPEVMTGKNLIVR